MLKPESPDKALSLDSTQEGHPSEACPWGQARAAVGDTQRDTIRGLPYRPGVAVKRRHTQRDTHQRSPQARKSRGGRPGGHLTELGPTLPGQPDSIASSRGPSPQ